MIPQKKPLGSPDANFPMLPILPKFIVFEDRDDGTLWLLTHSEDGSRIALTDDFSTLKQDYTVIRDGDGYPLTDQPNFRVFVRGGRLGYEENPSFSVSGSPIYTRRKMNRFAVLIHSPSSIFHAGDRLAYQVLRWQNNS